MFVGSKPWCSRWGEMEGAPGKICLQKRHSRLVRGGGTESVRCRAFLFWEAGGQFFHWHGREITAEVTEQGRLHRPAMGSPMMEFYSNTRHQILPVFAHWQGASSSLKYSVVKYRGVELTTRGPWPSSSECTSCSSQRLPTPPALIQALPQVLTSFLLPSMPKSPE